MTLNPRIIRKTDRVAGVPARWAAQYPRGKWSSDKDIKTDMLLALKGEDLTADRVNAIIGNTSWTACECDGCGRDFETLVRIGEEPDYEAQWFDLCVSCARAAFEVAGSAEVNTAHKSKIED